MKKQFKTLALVALLASAALVSCSNEDDTTTNTTEQDGGNETTVEEIIADLVGGSNAEGQIKSGETVTLKANTTYHLDGGLHVLDGGVLVVEEGVEIISLYDDVNTDYIFIEQGGKIEAVGTASAPIVMTSNYEQPGAWGGIHICGKAPINTGTPSYSEICAKPYGGDEFWDNSGTLKYLRVEYTGYSYNEDQECNGISFYGVGRGTTIEYVESYRGSDDGLEFFGGTVDIKYCIGVSNADDSFDWTDGWVGRGQFLVVYLESTEAGAPECDCLMECDNNGSNNSLEPFSRPILSNLTLLSDNDTENTNGVRLRAGTQVEIYNALIGGKASNLRIDSELTNASFATDNTSLLAGVAIEEGTFKNSEQSSEDGADNSHVYMLSSFLEGEKNSDTFVREDVLSNIYIGVIDDGVAVPQSDDATASFSFDSTATYIGAVKSGSDWTAGWSRLSMME